MNLSINLPNNSYPSDYDDIDKVRRTINRVLTTEHIIKAIEVALAESCDVSNKEVEDVRRFLKHTSCGPFVHINARS